MHKVSVQILDVVFDAMKSEEVWQAYVNDFCATKFEFKQVFMGMPLKRYLITNTDSSIRRRVADLHVCVRVHQVGAGHLTFLRVLDELDIRRSSQVCQDINIINTSPSKLFENIINAMYDIMLRISEDHLEIDIDAVDQLSSSCLLLVINILKIGNKINLLSFLCYIDKGTHYS